jgi:epoxyqueuosine reductase QueG/putative sterol carrier protein
LIAVEKDTPVDDARYEEEPMNLDDHPTVKWYRQQDATQRAGDRSTSIDSQLLKELCFEAGADDVGFVEIDRPAIADQRNELLEVFPATKTLICTAHRLHRENTRTVAHSATNLEFQQAWKAANRTARTIALRLQKLGFRALNVPVGFPMEIDRWPEKMWLSTDKINATEAGLGRMGWNRLVLHPKFGSNIVLGTILTDAEIPSYGTPLEFDPCIECKLCVSVCPVGAIAADGNFDFVSCYTHNYRERMGGFADWVANVVASRSLKDYRTRVSDSETVSMWQNLSIGGQTRCDRCMAVCPAGEEAIGGFLEDRKGYIEALVKKMHDKQETVYVVPGSDADAYVTSRLPHKNVKRVSNGLRPNSVTMFLKSLPIVFQRQQAEGLNATFHFTFTGDEKSKGTVIIRDKTVTVQDDLIGAADLHVTADSRTWIRFLAKETSLPLALVSRRIRIKGSPKLMMAFAKCFPA